MRDIVCRLMLPAVLGLLVAIAAGVPTAAAQITPSAGPARAEAGGCDSAPQGLVSLCDGLSRRQCDAVQGGTHGENYWYCKAMIVGDCSLITSYDDFRFCRAATAKLDCTLVKPDLYTMCQAVDARDCRRIAAESLWFCVALVRALPPRS